jgi:hypothetical protein
MTRLCSITSKGWGRRKYTKLIGTCTGSLLLKWLQQARRSEICPLFNICSRLTYIYLNREFHVDTRYTYAWLVGVIWAFTTFSCARWIHVGSEEDMANDKEHQRHGIRCCEGGKMHCCKSKDQLVFGSDWVRPCFLIMSFIM